MSLHTILKYIDNIDDIGEYLLFERKLFELSKVNTFCKGQSKLFKDIPTVWISQENHEDDVDEVDHRHDYIMTRIRNDDGDDNDDVDRYDDEANETFQSVLL